LSIFNLYSKRTIYYWNSSAGIRKHLLRIAHYKYWNKTTKSKAVHADIINVDYSIESISSFEAIDKHEA
jgi:hypothetical protein